MRIKRGIALIISVICLLEFSFVIYKIHFQYEWRYDQMMKSPETLDKSSEMSKEELLRNLDIIAEREGMNPGIAIVPNYTDDDTYDYTDDYYDETTIFENETPKKGDMISYHLIARFFSIQSTPMEVRFVIQAMLYIRDRNLSSEIQNIIGISGHFNTWQLLVYSYSGTPLKISVEDFEELYRECNADALSHEKKVSVMTREWIRKNDYNRGGSDTKIPLYP